MSPASYLLIFLALHYVGVATDSLSGAFASRARGELRQLTTGRVGCPHNRTYAQLLWDEERRPLDARKPQSSVGRGEEYAINEREAHAEDLPHWLRATLRLRGGVHRVRLQHVLGWAQDLSQMQELRGGGHTFSSNVLPSPNVGPQEPSGPPITHEATPSPPLPGVTSPSIACEDDESFSESIALQVPYIWRVARGRDLLGMECLRRVSKSICVHLPQPMHTVPLYITPI